MKTAKELELLLLVKEKKIQDLTLELEHEKSIVSDYGNRLIKAIEYIEKYNIEGRPFYSVIKDDLLNILQGSDKE